MHRRFLAGARWLAILVFALSVPLSSAKAHAKLLSSSPRHGEHLKASPDSVRLVFSERPVVSLSSIVIIGPDSVETTLAIQADPENPQALIARMPSLRFGTYTIRWRVVPTDGHPAKGEFSFAVDSVGLTRSPAAPLPVAEQSSPNELAIIPALLRGAALSALLAMCGLLGFTAYSESGGTESQNRLIKRLSLSATILFAAHFVAWLIHISPEASLSRAFAVATITSRVGADEIVRLLLSALATWALVLANRQKTGFAFALAAVLAGGAIGHSAAHMPVISIPVKAFHLFGVAFWIGGVLWLITAEGESLEAAGSVSSIAIVSISIVAITGLAETILFLKEPSDLVNSLYGILIIAKVAALITLAAFGAHHRNLIKRKTVDEVFKGSLRREMIVMIATVMIAGLLAYVPLS